MSLKSGDERLHITEMKYRRLCLLQQAQLTRIRRRDMNSVNSDNQLKVVTNHEAVMSGSKIDKISLTFDAVDADRQQFMKGYVWDLKSYPVAGVTARLVVVTRLT